MPSTCPQCGKNIPEHAPSGQCPACLLGSETAAETAADLEPSSMAASSAMLHGQFRPGAVLDERYRIVSLLGKGGMGEVYRADDLKLRQPVALKMLPKRLASDRALVDALYNEVRQARLVSHRNVCRVHDVGEWEGNVFLSMAFIEGEDLGTLLRRIGRLPKDKATDLIRQLCEGVQAGHDEGVLHLDLKPANLMIDRQGDLRITDFGLARLASEVEASGRLAGTPPYMAPEHLLEGVTSSLCDVYAIGLIAYEMLTGERGVPGRGLDEIRAFHATGGGVEIPGGLVPLLGECLVSTPSARLQSARALIEKLEVAMPAAGQTVLEAALPKSPTVPVEIMDESDVFLGYSPIDDQALMPAAEGWISQFHRNLEIRLQQLSGERVKVWRGQWDPEQDSDDPDQQVVQRLPSMRAMVSVVSPPFVKSHRCRREVTAFLGDVAGDVASPANRSVRMVKAVKRPVPVSQLEPPFDQVFSGQSGVEFFDRDPDTGRVREFDEAFGERARQRYQERIYDLAHELCNVLQNVADAEGGAPGKRVFLALATYELQDSYDAIKRVLLEKGHTVLPDHHLPMEAGAIEHDVRAALRECDLAIQLLGGRYGMIPENARVSVSELQNSLADEESRRHGFPRLIWMPAGLEIEDERQATFLRRVEEEDLTEDRVDVVRGPVSLLKEVLARRLNPAPEPKEDEGRSKPAEDGVKRLYLICDRDDETAIESLEDYLFEKGLEVFTPDFEADQETFGQNHRENLTDCDAVLIYYGTGRKSWVDTKSRDVLKATGYGRQGPIEHQAVFVAPPEDHRKKRYRTHSADVLRQEGPEFGGTPELDAYINKIMEGGHGS